MNEDGLSSTPSSTCSVRLRSGMRTKMLNGLTCTYNAQERQTAWLLALKLTSINPDLYIQFLSNSSHELTRQIQADVNRIGCFKTLQISPETTNELYQSLSRVLVAFSSKFNTGYFQAMSALAAPLVAVLPEPAAFYALDSLISTYLPSFFSPSLPGVHAAVSLIEEVLGVVDPLLSNHLRDNDCRAEIWSFQLTYSLLSIVKPLNEVIKVWDFLLAFRPCGPSIIVVVVTALVLLHRDVLLNSRDPKNVLKIEFFEPLSSSDLIGMSKSIISVISDDLKNRIINFVNNC
ncbi:hypothetical protein P9112_014221 [Eukaryota sp. TZLM1-RC]